MEKPSPMAELRRVALIGNSLPRKCGIATFTTDLMQAIATSRPGIATSIVAMNDGTNTYKYPGTVGAQIRDNVLEDYHNAAAFLNAGDFDAISLQHEFGIFGGDSGGHILALVTRLKAPLVTTLHTVLSEPTSSQHKVLSGIIQGSSMLVVMGDKGAQILRDVYRAPPEKVAIIPHGVPDFPLVEPEEAKMKQGFSNRTVILTFGLLSPNKGIEFMIDAMPEILRHCPDAVYVVLGATHPTLVAHEGEAYRHSLQARVHALGIEHHTVFFDQFVDKATLLGFIAMCDVYVTPYLNEAQMTSGTLAYSFGLGKAIVSTPYWHARELLANGLGVLAPFRDAAALSAEIVTLLTHADHRNDLRQRAYAASRSMTWENVAARHMTLLESVSRASRPTPIQQPKRRARQKTRLPTMQINHLVAMCDNTGLFQHAVHTIPDRTHGYCVDDNARALIASCELSDSGEQRLPDVLPARFAAFIQHAWNCDTRRFRNFMSFDRRWLEQSGSEDSHGRTLWALGVCARKDLDLSRRLWAADLFAVALPSVETFTSPRAWAFTLLGLDSYCTVRANDIAAQRIRLALATRLAAMFAEIATADWTWFETGLSYDNARLSQAMIVTGCATNGPTYQAIGLQSLQWLTRIQTTSSGLFRPVGTESFGKQRSPPLPFDQQPLEATAAIAANLAAYQLDPAPHWRREAERAFAWFIGENDLGVALVDVAAGSCRDGLHADRANENCGGESVISYLLGLSDIRALARSSRKFSAPRPPAPHVAA
jgi:glycosyltransferase involved in cell wall biosynthesis